MQSENPEKTKEPTREEFLELFCDPVKRKLKTYDLNQDPVYHDIPKSDEEKNHRYEDNCGD